MSQPRDYTVGWICAIRVEYIAAQVFLDEEHDPPEYISQHDNNHYTLGRIGKHNVVIATLPSGAYGTTSAATVAKDLLHSFPNLKIGLMVGIGGGAPTEKHDIRLGDVVVSHPGDGNGGLLQYDFGKNIQGQGFQITGFLNQPPPILLSALAGLRALHERKGHHLKTVVERTLQKNKRLRKKFEQPDPSSDRLYESEITHGDGEESCLTACGSRGLKVRHLRSEDDDDPEIHYGLIASANQLMKNALVRDQLASDMGILCFEMEAAGLMNHFPCLVIRGICDYSDSHKNKQWQGYAAMMAAAYTKDLLNQIQPNKVALEVSIRDHLSGLENIATKQLKVLERQLKVQKDQASHKKQKQEREFLQLFRLTSGTGDITYEWYKHRVEDRVEDTCMWFLRHQNFQLWLKADSGPLFVSADPGCGKSVLAKYLIDHVLPETAKTTNVCYFFFKAQDQHTIRQALCALIHQLFSMKPCLIETAIPLYEKDASAMINSTTSLWNVFLNAVKDPRAGFVTIILDAIDECSESASLIKSIEKHFYSRGVNYGKLKFLLTSRPYRKIISDFFGLRKSFPEIHIPGEEKSEMISYEVNHVIAYRIKRLSKKSQWSPAIENHLRNKLQHNSHRTYLWVYLIFEHLEVEDFKKTPKGIDLAIENLPNTVNEAYEQILSRSKNHRYVQKALSIILAACRPLTLSEMKIAMEIESTSQSLDDLDLETDEDFKARLRSRCGLFISIYEEKIHFLHQTAREFLLTRVDLGSPVTASLVPRFQGSITLQDAHNILAKCCVHYLDLFNSDYNPLDNTKKRTLASLQTCAFFSYSAFYWADHFREAQDGAYPDFLDCVMRIMNPGSRSFPKWYLTWRNYRPPSNRIRNNLPQVDQRTIINLPSFLGHHSIVRLLLQNRADPEIRCTDGRVPLFCAAENGHVATVKLLLEAGVRVDAMVGSKPRTSLFQAAQNGHDAVVNLLLESGADSSLRGRYYGTPLLAAVKNGHKATVGILLEKGADLHVRDCHGDSSLFLAAKYGHEGIISSLLNKGASIEERDDNDETPLMHAFNHGYKTAISILIGKGANIEAIDIEGQIPLIWAVKNGYKSAIGALVKKGASIEAVDNEGQTPLIWAVKANDELIVELLLEMGANVQARDHAFGQTALSWAAERGYKTIAALLIKNGADVEARDNFGCTPLQRARRYRRRSIVALLLGQGSDPMDTDSDY
ncbi:unnamed protein product [Clonostachys byssicola]|uniref:Nucleoside phosphorylase domain-containing protein n=1 Tax=Clonostachys byssicola TaxID=160290 RepID=A0A9N9UAM3_9HYPO|nr:unnamed protein product [Clonostachys byssicola]